MQTALISALVLLAPACAPSSLPVAQGTSHPRTLVLTHANVIDVDRGIVIPDQTIVIFGSRILSVQRGSDARVPSTAQQIDAYGSYVIPGLWDMHAHVLANYERFASVLLPNGITGIRHPGNSRLDTLRAVRERLGRATVPVPRLHAAGVLIDADPPARPTGSVTLVDGDHAAVLADSLLASGVDFFKVYSRLKREPFFALAAEARRRGVPLAGHVPRALTPEELSDAGMRSIEHVFEFPLACSSREADMRRLYGQAEGAADQRTVRMALADTLLRTYDRQKCIRIFRHLARNGTFVTPTLYLYKRKQVSAADSTMARYFATGIPAPGPELPEFGATDERARIWYEMLAQLAGEMNRNGVTLLAGTDTHAPLIWPGFSLHDELQTLVDDAQLTPAEALRTATVNPARYFAANDSMGTIAPGKVADLVLLSANPLTDIRHTRRIMAVVVNGRYLQRRELDDMLALAARAASGRE